LIGMYGDHDGCSAVHGLTSGLIRVVTSVGKNLRVFQGHCITVAYGKYSTGPERSADPIRQNSSTCSSAADRE
jgi:hypothetical protein